LSQHMLESDSAEVTSVRAWDDRRAVARKIKKGETCSVNHEYGLVHPSNMPA
jgi:hypothetical protein